MKWKKVAITVLAIIGGLPLAAFLYLYVAFSGGIEGVIASLKPAPDPNSRAITRKRTKVMADIQTDFASIEAGSDFAGYATSTHDRCYKGQHNFKGNDEYAHRCTFRMTRFYGMEGEFRDFRSQIVELEELLGANAWQMAWGSIRDMFTRFDEICGDGNRPVPIGFESKCSGSVSKLAEPYGYTKHNLLLQVAWAEKEFVMWGRKESIDVLSLEYSQWVRSRTAIYTHDKKEFHNVTAVAQKMTQSDRYMLAISIQGDYFEN